MKDETERRATPSAVAHLVLVRPQMRFAHIAAILICASAVAGEPPALKFDGLYCADDVDGFIPPVASYLRFYSDGTVVLTAARDTPEEAAKWIRRNDSTTSQGKYILEGRTLRFTVTNINGAVDYSGTIEGARLVLSRDARNEKKGKEVYRFVRLPLPTQ